MGLNNFSQDEKLLAEEFQSLKQRIKTELLRRKWYGDISAYGGEAYDYTEKDMPIPDGFVVKEQFNKLIEPMLQINKELTKASLIEESDTIIPNLEDMVTFLAICEANTNVKSKTNNCDNKCSGLCVTTCTSRCSRGCSNHTPSSGGGGGGGGSSGCSSGNCGGYCTGTCNGWCGPCGGCGRSCGGGGSSCSHCGGTCNGSHS